MVASSVARNLPRGSGIALDTSTGPLPDTSLQTFSATDPVGGGGGGGGGGAVTVMVALPLLPSLVAVMVADPAATPVTRPLVDTVATLVELVVQLMGRPVRTFPLASLSVAASCTVDPACTLAVRGATVTVATGGMSAVTTAVCADCAVAPPAVFVAVTLARIVEPTSPATST
jgi:hypothetical protein